MSEILQLDEQLFHLVNGHWANAFFDSILPFWRNKYVWIPFYFFLISFLLINFKKKGLFLSLALLVLIGISDTVSSKLIKQVVKRARPCHLLNKENNLRLLVDCGSGYSFTSSHATNHFALAIFLIITLGQLFRWVRLPLFLWATIIAYAQVYVGVHYPLDVISGAILGIVIGSIIAKLYQRVPAFQLQGIS